MQCFNPARFLLVFFLMSFLTVVQRTFAQIPHTLSYQAVLTDNAGTPKPDGMYTITFRLYTALSGGAAIWTEPQTLQVKRGLFSALLGSVTPFGVDLTFAQPYWLTLQVAPDAEMSPRLPLTSTAYSLSPWTSIGSSVYVSDVLVGLGIVPNPATGIRLDVNGTTRLAPGGSGGDMTFGTPNSETGMTISGATGRADVRFDGTTLRLLAGPAGSPPSNGIAITTSAVQMPNNVQLAVGAQGNQVQFGSPNSETGMSISGAGGRADLRFDGLLKLVNGPGGIPPATNGIAINTSGNVGIGMTSPLTRLALSGGPQWTSNLWNGTLSVPFGSAIGFDATPAGQRFGMGTAAGGLYFFRTTSAFGTTGSPANYDLELTDTGNLTQARDKGGLVKAMIYVNANGTIARCYNGITNSSTGNCGFSSTQIFAATYDINFNFQINDRFLSVTPEAASGVNIGTTFDFLSSNSVRVYTFITDVDFSNSAASNPFMIIIY